MYCNRGNRFSNGHASLRPLIDMVFLPPRIRPDTWIIWLQWRETVQQPRYWWCNKINNNNNIRIALVFQPLINWYLRYDNDPLIAFSPVDGWKTTRTPCPRWPWSWLNFIIISNSNHHHHNHTILNSNRIYCCWQPSKIYNIHWHQNRMLMWRGWRWFKRVCHQLGKSNGRREFSIDFSPFVTHHNHNKESVDAVVTLIRARELQAEDHHSLATAATATATSSTGLQMTQDGCRVLCYSNWIRIVRVIIHMTY